MSARLEAIGPSLGYEGKTIVHDLSLSIPAGKVTAIIGPNGCGKSTLLRGFSWLHPPATGEVLLDGVQLASLRRRSIAQRLALLPQSPTSPAGLTVLELVARGRTPHQRWYDRFSPDDERIVREALATTHLTKLADTPVDELSGGQRQRAWIALTLAQQTDVILLDEPTTYLDVAHQLEVLELMRSLNRLSRTTVVMVLHDLSLAARFSDWLVMMRAGVVTNAGEPDVVATPENLEETFGVRTALLPDPDGGAAHIVPLGLPPRK